MGCKCGTGKSELTEEQEKILKAMVDIGEICACKDIAEATGIPSKSVSCRLKSLRTKGYIQSPQRCKYEVTDSGRSVVV